MARTDPTDGELINLEDIRDEAFTNLHVSVEVKNLSLDFSTPEETEDNTDENNTLIDDIVTVYCSYDNPDEVNPPPSMKILMKNGNDFSPENNNEMLLAKGGIDDNNSTSNKYIGFNELRATKKISRGNKSYSRVSVICENLTNQKIFSL